MEKYPLNEDLKKIKFYLLLLELITEIFNNMQTSQK